MSIGLSPPEARNFGPRFRPWYALSCRLVALALTGVFGLADFDNTGTAAFCLFPVAGFFLELGLVTERLCYIRQGTRNSFQPRTLVIVICLVPA